MLVWNFLIVVLLLFRIPSSCTEIFRTNASNHDEVIGDGDGEFDEGIDNDHIERIIHSSLGHFRRTNIVKKAITPRRRLEYNSDELDHHNETKRPEFPMKEVAPDIIFKYPKGDNPPLNPIPINEPPVPALQPQIVIPPPPPAPAPIVINTGSGPAATITQAVPSTPAPPDPSNPSVPGADSAISSVQEALAGESDVGGNAASYNGMGGATGGTYNGSGPAMGGEKGLAGPYWPTGGSGSGIGERVEPYKTSPSTPGNWDGAGGDWIGTINGGEGEVPNQAANVGKVNGKAAGDSGGSGGGGGGGGDGVGGGSGAGGGCGSGGECGGGGGGGCDGGASGGAAACNGTPGKCKGGKCGADATLDPAFFKMFQILYKKFLNLQQQIRTTGTAEGGGRPTQIARGMLTAELFKLEDIIYNLNKKIDIIGDRVLKRPNLLGRAALMAGMTSTFGDLQNTVEILNEKLDASLKPQNQLLVASSAEGEANKQKSDRLANALEKLGAAGWLGVNGPAIGFTNYEMAQKAAHLEGLKMAHLKSNERLEDTMNLLADRMMGLQDHMDHIGDERDDDRGAPPPGRIDPLLRQEQQNLMLTQTAIVNQMGVIQDGLDRLSGAVKKLNDPPPAPPPVDTKVIGMVQTVLKNAADAFTGIAKQTNDRSTNFANHMVQTVKNAEQLVKSKEIKKLKYPFVPGGVQGDATVFNTGAMAAGLSNGVSGLAQTLGSTSGFGATGNPFIGSPFGLLGANEGVPQEHISQLAAAIASLPTNEPIETVPAASGTITGSAAIEPIDTSLFNYGTFGNGRPLTVVTGNLGGSLGLGGIGGIDGGNALVVNQTSSKKETICQSDIFTCVLTGTRRTFNKPKGSLLHVAHRHSNAAQSVDKKAVDSPNPNKLHERTFDKRKTRRRKYAERLFLRQKNHRRLRNSLKDFHSNKKKMKILKRT